MDYRQLFVALDLLHQHTRGDPCAGAGLFPGGGSALYGSLAGKGDPRL